jgi:hypothetical protein
LFDQSIEHLISQLEQDNTKLQDELRSYKKKFEDREYELMLENQKLKLENQDLISRKSRYENSKKELESDIKKVKEALHKEQDEVNKFKLTIAESDNGNIHQVESANKEIVQLKVQIE